ncbi:MAG TPA: amidohydrolase family protein [Myxococcales bacterium]|nr:amidohydrolase family protein [Myxococcales bacterium]
MRVLAAAACCACVHFPSYRELASVGPAHSLLIRDVRLFRGTIQQAEEHMDVLVENGRIAAVQPAGGELRAAETVDGRGLTLLPGFIDLHAHLTLTAAPPWYLIQPKPGHNAQAHVYAGVTTILDAGGNPEEILALQKKIADGAVAGPRIFFSGQHLTVPGGYPLDMLRDVYGRLAYWSTEGSHSRGVESVAEIEGEVDRIHSLGGRFIKLMVATIPPSGAPRLPDEMVRAAVKRAHANGMKVLAHIDTADDAIECARAGVDMLAHGIEAPAVTDEQARELAASGIRMEPTLVNYERFDELVSGHYAGSDMERASEPAELMAAFSDEQLAGNRWRLQQPPFSSWAEELTRWHEERPRNLYKLYKLGVPIYVGTDAQGSIAAFAGGYHDELRLMVAAGLPPAEVLLDATGRAAQFLDAAPDFGTIERGKSADLILVRGDPLADISATRNIERVYVRGMRVERR